MFNLVSLLVAAALVSLQCGFEASALLDNKQLDNHLNANVVPPHKPRAKKFVTILQHPPATAQLSRSAPLELSCEIQGAPAPTVQWLKNGEPIDYLDETNEITALYPTSLASVFSTLVVTTAASGDVFTCVGTNDYETATGSTTVYVEEGEDTDLLPLPRFTLPAKPVISTFYIHLLQDMGSNVVLPCRVVSPTEPQVYWQDTANNIIYGNSRMKVLPSGDLFISNIRWSDMGDYTCTAKNLYGKTTATSFLYPMRQNH